MTNLYTVKGRMTISPYMEDSYDEDYTVQVWANDEEEAKMLVLQDVVHKNDPYSVGYYVDIHSVTAPLGFSPFA